MTFPVDRVRSLRRAGFTLVEMLIALTIFGMLTAAGVALLTVTARTQQTSDRLLAELGDLRAIQALMTADLAQAAPRIHRGRDGRRLPAFAATAEPVTMSLVRAGWEGGGASQSTLQRVEYRLLDGRLERLSFVQVDGTEESVAVTLLDGISQLRLRYRDQEGAWHGAWAPTDGIQLPRAVELMTDSEAHGVVRQLFLVGAAL